MPTVIREQVITSTGVDSDGESFTRDEIRALFAQMHDSTPLVVRHDMSTRPIARSFNKQLKELRDGGLAITVDIEVFDEQEFSTFGGMSIGLVRNRYAFGEGPHVAAVTLNSKQFDVAAAGEQLASHVDGRFPFEVVERVEKSAIVTAAIVVIAGYAAVEVLKAFLAEAGKDLYAGVKKLRRRDDQASPLQVHFHIHLAPGSKTPVVVLAADANVTPADLIAVDDAPIQAAIRSAGGPENLQRVTASLATGGSTVVTYLVDAQGRPLPPVGGAT